MAESQPTPSAGQISVLEAIKRRRSVRTYSDQLPSSQQLDAVQAIIDSVVTKNPQPFPLIPASTGDEQSRSLRLVLVRKDFGFKAGYGMISGSKNWLLGVISENKWDKESLGYCLEKVIIEITRMGLGTVWMAGFSPAVFAADVTLDAGKKESLPCVTPVGVTAEQMGWKESLMRWAMSPTSRKPWSEIFFQITTADGASWDKLNESDITPALVVCLEALRAAPSAMNKQTWRIAMTKTSKDGKTQFQFHFLRVDSGYSRVDIGIAMANFELAAHEQGIAGHWTALPEPPTPIAKGLVEKSLLYTATWETD